MNRKEQQKQKPKVTSTVVESSDEDVRPRARPSISLALSTSRRPPNPGSAKLRIKIRTLDGKTFDIQAKTDWSVRRLKQAFEEWSGRDAASCMLQYKAKRLADNENLSTYKIDPESIIHANFRSTGGKL